MENRELFSVQYLNPAPTDILLNITVMCGRKDVILAGVGILASDR